MDRIVSVAEAGPRLAGGSWCRQRSRIPLVTTKEAHYSSPERSHERRGIPTEGRGSDCWGSATTEVVDASPSFLSSPADWRKGEDEDAYSRRGSGHNNQARAKGPRVGSSV